MRASWLAPHNLLSYYIICLASYVGVSDHGAQGDDAQNEGAIATPAGPAEGYLRCSTRQAGGDGADAPVASARAKKGQVELDKA
jgi:hypothetical protein